MMTGRTEPSYDRNAPLLDLGIASTVIVAAVFIFGGAALRRLLRH